jgi:hypothetical protein
MHLSGQYNAPFGPDACAVIIKKSKTKQATTDAAVHALVASNVASHSSIKSKKKRVITTHTVDLGLHKAILDVNATGRNLIVQLK